MRAGTGHGIGLVLFAMCKRNITAIYTYFFSPPLSKVHLRFILFSMRSGTMAMPRPSAYTVQRVNAKMRKRSVRDSLGSSEITFRWAWTLNHSVCCALRARLFPLCWLLFWLPTLQTYSNNCDQSSPSTGLRREKLGSLDALWRFTFFSPRIRVPFGFIDHWLNIYMVCVCVCIWEIKSKSRQAAAESWTSTVSPVGLDAELSSKFVPWVFRFATRLGTAWRV